MAGGVSFLTHRTLPSCQVFISRWPLSKAVFPMPRPPGHAQPWQADPVTPVLLLAFWLIEIQHCLHLPCHIHNTTFSQWQRREKWETMGFWFFFPPKNKDIKHKSHQALECVEKVKETHTHTHNRIHLLLYCSDGRNGVPSPKAPGNCRRSAEAHVLDMACSLLSLVSTDRQIITFM